MSGVTTKLAHQKMLLIFEFGDRTSGPWIGAPSLARTRKPRLFACKIRRMSNKFSESQGLAIRAWIATVVPDQGHRDRLLGPSNFHDTLKDGVVLCQSDPSRSSHPSRPNLSLAIPPQNGSGSFGEILFAFFERSRLRTLPPPPPPFPFA